ncbi:MAG: hypothetical protein NUV80_07385 [Candidatus Berkelbacteria bacterium]|nr:hypothetical protein [Candidatus Berkelbacteria bacterium]
MRIEIIKTETESKGKYNVCTVSYRGPDGKVEQKKLMSFGPASEAFKKLKDASANDVFEVKSEQVKNEKDGKEYWYWTEAVVTGKVDPSVGRMGQVGVSTASPRSTYETPEERARKQVYIVRQSSITAALHFLLNNGSEFSVKDTIKVAKEFEAFVFDTTVPDSGFNLPNIEVR